VYRKEGEREREGWMGERSRKLESMEIARPCLQKGARGHMNVKETNYQVVHRKEGERERWTGRYRDGREISHMS
jgi:hypothetical protein